MFDVWEDQSRGRQPGEKRCRAEVGPQKAREGRVVGRGAVIDGKPDEPLRAKKMRCFLSHQDIPRIEGSTLYENALADGASAEPDEVQKAGSRVTSLGLSNEG
ncbi:MAG: hypothetical protein CMJ89_11350 [Planctomycetes bacterium]|nr:hypothetical protein [Planctomycetota bacterium]